MLYRTSIEGRNAIKVFSAVLLGIMPICHSGCLAFHRDNPLPGEQNRISIEQQGIPVSEVLTAVKIQIAQALREAEALKRRHPNSAISGLTLKNGAGSLTATLKSDTLNNGDIKSIIPFSTYTGTQTTPFMQGSWDAASTREETFNFIVSTEIKENQKYLPEMARNIETGSSIRDAIIGTYNDILKIPTYNSKEIPPELIPMSISMKFTFVVEKKKSGKVEIKFVPVRTFNEITPSLSGSQIDTKTHQITLSLPFVTPDVADKRELIYAVAGMGGTLFVKEPYSETRYKQLTKGPKIPDKPPVKVKSLFGEFLIEPVQPRPGGLLTPLPDPRGF